MTLAIGSVLRDRYRIARLVGKGGFGAVYRAWDLSLSQPVALKENNDSGFESLRQFEREAKLLASLRHPSLPRVIDHFVLPDQGQYLVMDFIEGKSLAQLLRERGGPLDETEAGEWIGQICNAVEYLHTRTPPVIHRDIKPDNIIITADGRAVLVDFGISKVYEDNHETTKGAKAITPGYSPPEQYGLGKTNARSDVYSLGATLYALLTGKAPPEATDLVSGANVMTPPRQANPAVSEAAAQAILAAMMPSISQRLASAAQFEQVLTGRLALPTHPAAPPSAPLPDQTPTAPTPTPAPPNKSRGARRGCMLSGVVLAAVLIGAIGMLLLLIQCGGGFSVTPVATPDSGGALVITATTPANVTFATNFAGIHNDAPAVYVAVPAAWNDADGPNAVDEISGAALGSQLTTSTSIASFGSNHVTPGVQILASAGLGGIAVTDMLNNFDFSADCAYDGRFPYSDVIYTGVYDQYSNCGGQGSLIHVLAVEPADRSYALIRLVQAVTQAELDHI